MNPPSEQQIMEISVPILETIVRAGNGDALVMLDIAASVATSMITTIANAQKVPRDEAQEVYEKFFDHRMASTDLRAFKRTPAN